MGRSALAQALETARERAALGGLPFVLFLLARDHATSDRWAVAEAIYEEAIGMARETDQRTDLASASPASRGSRPGAVGKRPARWPARRSGCPPKSERVCTRCGRPPRLASSSSVSVTPRGRPRTSRISAGCSASLGSPTSISLLQPSSSTPTSGSARRDVHQREVLLALVWRTHLAADGVTSFQIEFADL